MPEQITISSRLKRNPNVIRVERNKILLKIEFRIKLFNLWKEGDGARIPEVLAEAGLGAERVGNGLVKDLIKQFKLLGYPMFKRWELDINPDLATENPLLSSGKFELASNRSDSKVVITKEFEKELFAGFPEIDVEDALLRVGIDPLDVGSQYIRNITKRLEERNLEIFRESSGNNENIIIPRVVPPTNGETCEDIKDDVFDAKVEAILTHPYVKLYDGETIVLADFFYNEAYFLSGMNTLQIFEMYELDKEWFSDRNILIITAKLHSWVPSERSIHVYDGRVANIWRRRIKVLVDNVEKGLYDLQDQVKAMELPMRRAVAKWIDSLPRDPWDIYTTRKLLQMVGIPKSTYYELLNNENYGKGIDRRKFKDDEDIKLIEQVADYKGYRKGYRQVSMMMKLVTGKEMSPHRVQMLMRRYGMKTGLRSPSKNRKGMRSLINKNGKENALMRRFRLHRPNEVRLTDVTYLDYGDNLRAYGSACIDPVTGRLICFIVSENNDLQLALDTLAAMDEFPAVNGGIIHSDQGILYFTDDFQNAVKEMDLIQSMSRRGNCWDNAPQESFFGHFKDECDYKRCATLKELQACIDSYRIYYNYERHIWDRLKMTPVEYEMYLCGLSDEEFEKYLSEEEEKYRKKKEEAAKKAIDNAKKNRMIMTDTYRGDEHENS